MLILLILMLASVYFFIFHRNPFIRKPSTLRYFLSLLESVKKLSSLVAIIPKVLLEITKKIYYLENYF